ncbi:inner membrane-spanning protein YciB [Kangiella sp. TOML190]|uniref:inner membrane-spanning protein YciB n=1 Tax=Kangiella sp. TOML190 TaxID=2931351 RepID=UPI00203AAFFB|nr:septation protein IspZ [Kangiella sp. TOML190]
MKFLKENYPLVGFLVAYIVTKNLILAAAVWSAGSLLQILTSLVLKEPVKKSHLAYFVLGLALLAMAYYFNDESFIKWKTTVMVWAGAVVILIRQLVSKKYVFMDLTQSSIEFKAEPPIKKLESINAIWIMTLAAFGALNLYVAYNFSTDFWFYFKMIGLFLTLMGLMVASFVSLAKYLKFDDEETTSTESDS